MSEAQPSLVRALRRRDLIGILLNTMIGAGMLAAPAKVYGIADGWSFLVLLASAVAILPLILCFADLGSRFSGTGGPYLYARAALPGPAAFAVGWLLWFSQTMSTATLSNLFVTYLAGFFPVLGAGWPRLLIILLLGLALTWVALRGIQQSARASNALIALKMIFVVVFVAACLPFVDPGRFAVTAPAPGPVEFAQAMIVFLFGYSGFERGAILAGEAREPQKDVPIALGASVALVTLAYAGVLFACLGVLDAPAANDRPFAEAGRSLYGAIGATAVSAGALVVIVGTLLVIIVSMPRMLLALAENGQVPARLGAIHARWRTPHVAIFISSIAAFGFAMLSDLLTALTISTAARIVAYVLSCVALIRLSRRADAPAAGFNAPARIPLAILTIVIFTGVMLLGAQKELVPLLAFTAFGFVLFLLMRRRA